MATKTILVVDQDLDFDRLLTILLEEEGYKVTVTESLADAAALLRDSRFDLIISEAFNQDSKLDFDPSFLEQIRSQAGDTPIVLVSTYVEVGLRPVDFGLVAASPKPIDLNELLDEVRKSLDEARQTTEEVT